MCKSCAITKNDLIAKGFEFSVTPYGYTVHHLGKLIAEAYQPVKIGHWVLEKKLYQVNMSSALNAARALVRA